jgi:hypothetical protein
LKNKQEGVLDKDKMMDVQKRNICKNKLPHNGNFMNQEIVKHVLGPQREHSQTWALTVDISDGTSYSVDVKTLQSVSYRSYVP